MSLIPSWGTCLEWEWFLRVILHILGRVPLSPGAVYPLSNILTSSQAQYLMVPLPTKSFFFFLFHPVFLFPTLPHRKPALSSVTGTSELFSKGPNSPLPGQTTEASLSPSHYLGMTLTLLRPTNSNTHIYPALQTDLWNLFLGWNKREAISSLEKIAPMTIYICIHCKMLQTTNNQDKSILNSEK